MALTDVKCRGTKPGKTRQKLSDGGGLQFWVQPNGSRLWQLVYQYQGKQAQMALGPYPQVSLIEARACRGEVKAKIRAGVDPTAEKRRVEVAKALPGDTFKEIALEFIEKCRRDQLAGPTMAPFFKLKSKKIAGFNAFESQKLSVLQTAGGR
jgi:hypothetical protein